MLPTTLSPVISNSPTLFPPGATSNSATIGIALGSVAGVIVVSLGAFVLYRRRDSVYASMGGAPKTTWLAQVDMNAPPRATVPAAYNAPNKYNIPPGVTGESFQSGNPVYTGIVRDSAKFSTPPLKLTKDYVFDKLRRFYEKIDPQKSVTDINDLTDWVMYHGEEALYIKLRKKYGADPNTVGVSASQPKLVLGGDVDV